MIKGQAKKDFEKWLNEPIKEHGRFGQLVTNTFDTMPFSMQIGVLIDWFDSVGIRIEITKSVDWSYWINDEQEQGANWIPTRTKARTKAIEQAMLIYNER